MAQSLFERIGGHNAVMATVNKMYDKILSDDELAPFFENSDVATLRKSQAAFVTFAFGGMEVYSGSTLRKAHEKSVHRGLNDHHFDLVAGYLREAMEELNVAADLIHEALKIVGSTRNEVLNK
jgi:hemoglobin